MHGYIGIFLVNTPNMEIKPTIMEILVDFPPMVSD